MNKIPKIRTQIAKELGLVQCNKWRRFNSQSMMKECSHADGKCYPKEYGPPKYESELSVFFEAFEKWLSEASFTGYECGFDLTYWFEIYGETKIHRGGETLAEAGCRAWLAAIDERKGV